MWLIFYIDVPLMNSEIILRRLGYVLFPEVCTSALENFLSQG